MVDTYTDRLGLIEQEEGTHANEWGDLLNLNLARLDSATRGYVSIALAGTPLTLDSTDISTTSSTAQENSFFSFIEFTGTGGSTVTVPAEDISWTVYNNSDDTVTFTPLGGTGVVLAVGKVHHVIYGSNGTTFTDVTDLGLINATLTNVAISGTSTFTGTVNTVTTTEFAMLSGRTLASTDDVIDNFPSGTAMLFYQTAAPTGWTRDVTAAMDDHALRVVTDGTWGSGTNGTRDFTTQFAEGFAGEDYTLLTADIPAHTHGSVGNHTHTVPRSTTGGNNPMTNSGSSTTTSTTTSAAGGHTHASVGGGGAHAHDVNLGVKYLDVIIATKD